MTQTRKTFLDRRPFIWFWRPIYRYIYTPFYHRIYASLIDGLSARQTAVLASETRMARQTVQQTMGGHYDDLRHEIRAAQQESHHHVSAELRAAQEEARRQWLATEHLLLNSLLSASSESARNEAAAVNRLLLDQVYACGREVDRMTEKFASLEAEMDRRWSAIERLLLTVLAAPSPRQQALTPEWPVPPHSSAPKQSLEQAGY